MRIRTGYSFKTAIGRLPEVASRLSEIGWTKAPITDRNSTYGFVRWKEVAEKAGLEPVYGVEIGVTSAIGAKKPSIDYWTFYASGRDLGPLNELVYLATGQPGSLLLLSQANKAIKGIVAVAGDTSDPALVRKGIPFSLSPETPIGQFKRVAKAGRTFVANSANYYPRTSDRELYRVMIGRGASANTFPQWILSDEEYVTAMKWVGAKVARSAIVERDRLLESCNAKLRIAEILVPNKKKTLRAMCIEGAKRKGINLSDPVYRDRLDRELKLIALKEFEDYFYIIADMVSWAKTEMVVGPARGSSCGSLACYLLDITAIDPIPFGLLFERFIDITRSDLPDIDLDFSDERRELVFRYAEKKYGKDHVARLGSVSMFGAKSILNQVGKALKIPTWTIEELSNTIIKRSTGDSRASSTIEDAFIDTEIGRKTIEEFPEVIISAKMEGHPVNAGQHAAGVVITKEPVTHFVAIDGRTGATMCDKKDAEKLGLLKIDALGLTQLGVFERCLDLIGEPGLSRFLEKLPIDDQSAYDVINDMKFSGVFQFGPGSASAGLVSELIGTFKGSIDSIEDIISLTALVRPGPLGSGAAREWVKRRAGASDVEYFHPQLEPYVNSTLGIVVYQEQVMQIGREIGDLSWDDVTALRKAMSRSLGKEYFDQYGDRWKAGAKKKGWNEADRNKCWDDLCLFGMWAFNRSHSVAYAFVSYWCLWLKAHYPLEFAAATLDTEDDPLKQVIILKELRVEGVGYTAIDPLVSTDRWQIANNRLIGPITAIKGIGPAKVAQILDARLSGKPLQPGLEKLLAACETEIDTLDPIGDAVKRVVPDLAEINIFSTPIPIAEVIPGKFDGEVLVIGVIQKIAPVNENQPTRVAQRGGVKWTGPLEALNIRIRDDSGDDIFCKVNRYDFPEIGRPVLEKCKAGKSLYAIKGIVPANFRMIRIKQIRYLGEMG